ncbi:MAG: preprotein translocase subunit TatB, partial [Proteobacteria bacterium]|nr:preprotein translocase subunit TatB [Pseudomonadota bacterium]
MEKLLERFGQPDQDPVRLWSALVDKLRPARPTDTDQATGNLRELGNLLARRPDLLANLRTAVLELFAERKQVTMYVSSGLLPSTGFFSETSRRFGSRMLPELLDTTHLKDLLSAVFHRVDDEVWVRAIADEAWQDFLRLLVGHQTPMFEEDASPLPSAVGEILESLRVLSFHVSAIGLDRELVRIDPHLEEHESPFLAQNAELLAYIGHYKAWWTTPGALIADDKHLTVMLHQCDEVLQRVRKRAMRVGTSLTLTFKLERLRQHLERIHELIALLG